MSARFFVKSLAAAASLAVTGSVMAAPVTYTTSGLFFPTAGPTPVAPAPAGTGATTSGQGGGGTLTYTAQMLETVNTDTFAGFGSFLLGGTTTSTNFAGTSFLLGIFQTSPTNQNGTLVGTLSGVFSNPTGGTPSSTVTLSGLGALTFVNAPAASPTVFNPNDVTTISANEPTTLGGLITGGVGLPPGGTAIPLPAAAWGGIALMGLLAGTKARRRAKVA